MSEIILDLETQNTFRDVGFPDTRLLRVSVVGIYNYAGNVYQTFLEEELSRLWPILESCQRIIGYNIRNFDLPVLRNYYGKNIQNFAVLDIFEEIRAVTGRRLRLDNIAKATLGFGKSGDGLQAVELWKKGDLEKLKAYCLQDVKITRALYEYGEKHGILSYHDLRKIKRFPVNFKTKTERSVVNFTLPF